LQTRFREIKNSFITRVNHWVHSPNMTGWATKSWLCYCHTLMSLRF